MKIRWSICLLSMMLLVVMLCACGATGNPEPEKTMPISAAEVTPKLTPTPTPKPTSVLRSYTTGIPITEQKIYKPVGVMIENSSAARPQYGLQAADIIYEAPVEGCTRLFCIYNDTLPEKVGPVRSARLYFIKIQQEWDSAYVHFGGPESGQANVYLDSSNHIKTRINFIKGDFNDYYWRDKDKKAPHNAFTDVQKCQELMKEESKVRTFQYADTLQYSGNGFSEVVLPFYSGEVTYKYNAQQDVLERYMERKAFTDAATGDVVSVKNLIVQYNSFSHGDEAKGRWMCQLLGTGKADFFVGGQHIQGTWERQSYETPTIYKDSAGKEIILLPGNTWIAIHPDDKSITVK